MRREKPKTKGGRAVAGRATTGREVSPQGEVVLYEAADGGPGLEVRLERDTVWLSQAQMVDLFERDQSVVSRHLRNVFAEGELDAGSNMRKMHIAGSTKPTAFYNLDAIISVGYRVKSNRGTQFRIWATRVLREHLVRGYTVNERRLKELQQAVRLVAGVAERRELSSDEAKAAPRLGKVRALRRRQPRGRSSAASGSGPGVPEGRGHSVRAPLRVLRHPHDHGRRAHGGRGRPHRAVERGAKRRPAKRPCPLPALPLDLR